MRNMRNTRRSKIMENFRRPSDIGEDVIEKQHKLYNYKDRFRILIDDMYDAYYAFDDETVAECVLVMDDIIDALENVDF